MTNIDTRRETNFAVTLTPSNFGENTYIARVPRKTVTTDQILDLVAAHNQGIDRYQVGHAMELLKTEILEQAELGFSVDIMEICKLYIAPLRSVKSLTPEAEEVSGFEAHFSVNDRLKERLRGMTAAVTAVVRVRAAADLRPERRRPERRVVERLWERIGRIGQPCEVAVV